MAWLNLCGDDPLVKTLSGVFHANIIRVPEQRMQPLKVLARRSGRLAYRGPLADLLGTTGAGLSAAEVLHSGMADLSGKRSRTVKASLGLGILEGFLSGFGVSAAGDIAQTLSGAQTVSFSFSNVVRDYIEPTQIGKLLANARLDTANPAARDFLGDDPWEALLIDSVITSTEFTIRVEEQESSDFKLNVPAVQAVLSHAGAEVAVSSASSTSLTFKGPKPRAFAFTCLALVIAPDGRILSLPAETEPQVFGFTLPGQGQNTPARVQISESPVMLEIED